MKSMKLNSLVKMIWQKHCLHWIMLKKQ